MYNIWIIVTCLAFLSAKPINGQSELDVQLAIPRFVERGSSATMKCRHNVRPEILFKVTWLKVDKGKFFEFINGRNPPFRNFTIDGAEIDWENSNETQVTLRNVDFEMNGQFYCEVSTDTPIFTKPSADELLTVFLPQTGPPTIKFRKRTPFSIGERLLALCNTTRARPAPHITWLINGKKVDERYVRTHHVYSLSGKNHRRSQSQQMQQQLHQKYYQQNLNQYQQQYQTPYLFDRYDKSLRWSGRPDDLSSQTAHNHDGGGSYGFQYATNFYNNPFSSLANMHDIHDSYNFHEVQHRNYDNRHVDVKKHIEMKKHRNQQRKYRRHINENALGIIRSTLNNGGFGPQPPNINNELGIPPNAGPMSQLAAGYGRPLSHTGGGSGVAAAAAAVTAAQQEKGMFSISQLNIELNEQHIGTNSRMEITCLSTIPAAVGQGEQFADYKTFSVKVEVERQQSASTSTIQPNIGMAALGNGASTSAAVQPSASNKVQHVWLMSFLPIASLLLLSLFKSFSYYIF